MGNDCKSFSILKSGTYDLPDLILKNTYHNNHSNSSNNL